MAKDKGPNFTKREVFEEVLNEVPRKKGGKYEDIEVAYGDMSRLVVGFLARTPPKELKQLYFDLGWKGKSVNVRQMHLAARKWYEKYQKKRLATVVGKTTV